MEEYILEIFNSKEELCTKYKIDNIKILKLDDEGAKTKLALIKTKNSNLKFIFMYYDMRLKPQLINFFKKNFIILGIQSKIIRIDLENNVIDTLVDFSIIPFFEFLENDSYLIAIFEMGISVINEDGELKWKLELPEILIDWEIVDENIKLSYFDGKIGIHSLKTGELLS